ncbi:MAG: hypothetical protein ACYDBZ_00010 [Steroidobacteraceae bacterium]
MTTKVAFLSTKSSLGIAAAAACVLLSGPVLAGAPDDGFACSNATLNGNYGFTITGIRPAARGLPQVALVGTALTTFHGDGTFDQFDNLNVNSPEVTYQPDRPGLGSYSLNSDCSGTMTLIAGGVTLQLSITVVDHGREVRTAVVTPAVIVTSNGRRI